MNTEDSEEKPIPATQKWWFSSVFQIVAGGAVIGAWNWLLAWRKQESDNSR